MAMLNNQSVDRENYQFSVEASLPTPMTARVELLIYQSVICFFVRILKLLQTSLSMILKFSSSCSKVGEHKWLGFMVVITTGSSSDVRWDCNQHI